MSGSRLGINVDVAAGERGRMEANLEHWEAQASAHGAEPDASWGDRHAIDLEIQNLLRWIEPGSRVLDVGCANGYTTFHVLARGPSQIKAYDFSPAMIEAARQAAVTGDPNHRIAFSEGNILKLPEPSDHFDLVYAIRVLINLPTWELQLQAIREMHRVLRPGGRYVLSEGFSGSMGRINALRALAGLPAIAPPSFNVLLDEERLEQSVAPFFEIEEVSPFASVYYVATRFLRDLSLRGDEPPSYDGPLHRLARELSVGPRGKDFSGIKAYVLRKR